jgi:RimJ/RimL family protein N-acetyltransferase
MAWVADQPRARSISATVPEDNLPSRHLAAKLGLVRTSHTRRNFPVWMSGVTKRRETVP